jgi:hypothetical protein
MKQLFVPLLLVLWSEYTWKYICYQWMKKMQSVFLDVKLNCVCNWNQITCFLCIIYSLDLIDIYFQAQTLQILKFYVKLSFIQTNF